MYNDERIYKQHEKGQTASTFMDIMQKYGSNVILLLK